MAKTDAELVPGVEEVVLGASCKSRGPFGCSVLEQGDGIGNLVSVAGEQSLLGDKGVQLM